MGIDKAVRRRVDSSKSTPHDSFSSSLFRQPSLAEGRLRPSSYRKCSQIVKSDSTADSCDPFGAGGNDEDASAAVETAGEACGEDDGDSRDEIEQDVSTLLQVTDAERSAALSPLSVRQTADSAWRRLTRRFERADLLRQQSRDGDPESQPFVELLEVRSRVGEFWFDLSYMSCINSEHQEKLRTALYDAASGAHVRERCPCSSTLQISIPQFYPMHCAAASG